jgi:uncharacterized protein (DUF1330 family)
MAGYFITSYDISDPATYATYSPGGMPILMKTLARHGGKILVVGPGAEWDTGARESLLVIEFPDTDAAHAWVNDPEYAALKKIRVASTTHRMEVIAPSFTPRGT